MRQAAYRRKIMDCPVGTLMLGMPARVRLRAEASHAFSYACLAILPWPRLQESSWVPSAATSVPEGQAWGWQIFISNRIPTAIITATSSNRRPHDDIRRDRSQSPVFGVVTALHLALSAAMGSESPNSFMTRPRSRLSQLRCFALCALSGRSASVAVSHWVLSFSRSRDFRPQDGIL